MKFIKGVVVGTMITAGVAMMYTDSNNRKKIMKQGKKFMKVMGM